MNEERQMVKNDSAVIPTLLLLLVSSGYLFACPYTKVEESFGMQATHDLYYYGCRPAIRQLFSRGNGLPYDHLQYPGVVPRTFLGSAIMALATQVISTILYPVVQLDNHPMAVQVISRWTLLVFNLICLRQLALVLPKAFRQCTPLVSTWFMVICACQFHIPYYMSRTLPNSFALGLCSLAMKEWCISKPYKACWILVLTLLIFRCDVILLWGCVGLIMWLFQKQVSVFGSIITAISAAVTAFIISIPLDSLLWQRWIWPEGHVLLFNTVENKSSEWGIMPWHWYFSRALPRMLLATAILVPLSLLRITEYFCTWYQAIVLGRQHTKHGVHLRSTSIVYKSTTTVAYPPFVDSTFLPFLGAALLYIILYSFLPHKEVRFLFPVLPIINVGAALGMDRLYRLSMYQAGTSVSQRKIQHDDAKYPSSGRGSVVLRLMRSIPLLCGMACLVFSLVSSLVFVAMSRHNYPGGVALSMLRHDFSFKLQQQQLQQASTKTVCVDVAAAMTGVTLFGQSATVKAMERLNPNASLTFIKEGYEGDNQFKQWNHCDYLLTEEPHVDGFSILHVSQGNPTINKHRKRIDTRDAIYVMQHK